MVDHEHRPKKECLNAKSRKEKIYIYESWEESSCEICEEDWEENKIFIQKEDKKILEE